MNLPCIQCKGRNPKNCGRTFCPITAKYNALFKIKDSLKSEDFQGSSPAPFIGRFGYPYVNVGLLSPPEIKQDAWIYDSPIYWSDKNFKIPKIVDLRSALINSRFKANIKQQNKLLDISKEVGMASKPVDLEINLQKKPLLKLTTSADLAPMGPSANLKKAKITSNPKIHTKVEKVVSDFDLKSVNALIYLYKSGFDENFLSKLLSVGTLGKKLSRKLVPTRWSITSIDSSIGNDLLKQIKYYNQIDSYEAYFGSYLGNYYLILCFPEVWSYELFETYLPNASWNISNKTQYTTDYEPCTGRKKYAEQCAGGFYATRFGVLEKLSKFRKQASVLVLRFITGEYSVPLGVFVCRQATRKALENKPIIFSSKELLIKYAKVLIKRKFGTNIDFLLENSLLLKSIKHQKKLVEF
ncbi:hypothetical protein KY304_02175 [Candidatus Woesearchaeota archaeon]|nr:hypothetical protein [Candidatus Woesearchaeota archaeon]